MKLDKYTSKHRVIIEKYESAWKLTDIANTEGLDNSSLTRIIKKLKAIGAIDEDKREKALIENRKETLLSECKGIIAKYKTGCKQTEIAEKEGLSNSTVSEKLKELKKLGLIDDEEERKNIEKEAREKTIKKIEKRIKQMYEEKGYDIVEISQVEGKNANTILNRLKEAGEIDEEKRKQAVKVRRQEILVAKYPRVEEKYRAGYKQTDIAKEEGISDSTVSRAIEAIKEIEKRRMKELREYIIYLSKRTEKLEENDIDEIRQIMEKNYQMISINDVIFLINAYNSNKQYSKALKFVETILEHKDLEQANIDRLIEIKMKIENHIEKIKTAQLIKKGIPINEIKNIVHLSEEEIMQIEMQIELRTKKTRLQQGPSID